MRNESAKNAAKYRECMSMLDRPLIECNKEMLQKAERMIKEYLDEGFPPDFRISRTRKPELKYNTLLHKAITIRPWDPDIKYKLPDTLLDHGADPNITDAWGWNGLMTALLFNQPRKLVERIFKSTDNLDHRTDDGKNVVVIAYDSFIMLEDDEDEEIKNSWGNIKFLLDAGMNPSIRYLQNHIEIKREQHRTESAERAQLLLNSIENYLARKKSVAEAGLPDAAFEYAL